MPRSPNFVVLTVRVGPVRLFPDFPTVVPPLSHTVGVGPRIPSPPLFHTVPNTYYLLFNEPNLHLHYLMNQYYRTPQQYLKYIIDLRM